MLSTRWLTVLPGQVRGSAATFRIVLAEPRVRAVVVSSLIARLPKGMSPLATVLLLHDLTGSYATAGVTAAVVALGDAATTPMQGRLIDRVGRARVLLPTAAIHVVAIAALLVLARPGTSVVWLATAGVLAGVGIPPVSGCMKAVWSELVPADRLTAAYALESLLQQAFYLTGPLAVAVLVAVSGAAVALATSASLVAVGTAGFVCATESLPTVVSKTRPAGALRVDTVRVLLGSVVLQSMTFGVVPVGLAAVTAGIGKPGLAGVLQAMLTTGGVLGTFGPVPTANHRTYPRLLAAFSIALLPVAVCGAVGSPPAVAGIGVILVTAGLFLTPIAAVSYVLVHRATPMRCRTEAFAWLSTGQAIGTAAGSSLAGVLTEHGGPALAFAAAPVMVAVGALLSRVFLNRAGPCPPSA